MLAYSSSGGISPWQTSKMNLQNCLRLPLFEIVFSMSTKTMENNSLKGLVKKYACFQNIVLNVFKIMPSFFANGLRLPVFKP